jgi:hypothetical protein
MVLRSIDENLVDLGALGSSGAFAGPVSAAASANVIIPNSVTWGRLDRNQDHGRARGLVGAMSRWKQLHGIGFRIAGRDTFGELIEAQAQVLGERVSRRVVQFAIDTAFSPTGA